MRPLLAIVFAAALLFGSPPVRSSEHRFEYLSPIPGSTMVSPLTNIIVRPARGSDSRAFMNRSTLRVTGSRSGRVDVAERLSDDARTLTYRPAAPFLPGESVTVNILTRTGPGAEPAASVQTFSFSVSEQPAGRGRVRPHETDAPFAGRGIFSGTGVPQGAIPPDFPAVTITASDNPTPGYLFLSNMTLGSGAPNSPYVMILDNNGQPVFYRRTPSECTDFKMQPNGLITYEDSNLGCFLALDSTYAVVDTFRCGNGYATNWHELRLLPDGHALLLGDDPQIVRMDTIVPNGSPSALVMGIVIQELDRAKEVVFQWRTFDHFKITDATHEDLTSSLIDCVHANAIEPDTGGTLMLSSRHMDEITKIDRQTGEIIWRWGGKNNQFTFVNDTLHFLHQHAIRRLASGNVTLFDNGDFRYPILSRGVEYALDEQAKRATLVWQYRKTPDVYASAMGYVQRLPGGNSIIGWGATNPTLTEVTPDGHIALELAFPTGVYSYRAFRFPWRPVATGVKAAAGVPRSFSAEQNYPNPFNPATVIGYSIPEARNVSLVVLDILGRRVATLVSGREEAGYHTARFDGTGMGSGVYFYRLQAGSDAAVKRMLFIK